MFQKKETISFAHSMPPMPTSQGHIFLNIPPSPCAFPKAIMPKTIISATIKIVRIKPELIIDSILSVQESSASKVSAAEALVIATKVNNKKVKKSFLKNVLVNLVKMSCLFFLTVNIVFSSYSLKINLSFLIQSNSKSYLFHFEQA